MIVDARLGPQSYDSLFGRELPISGLLSLASRRRCRKTRMKNHAGNAMEADW